MGSPVRTLSMAIKRTPMTKALLSGKISSPSLDLVFDVVEPIHEAFKPMVRDLRYDVSELAVFTALQAFDHDKPIVLLPVVLASRFQHGCLVYNREKYDRLTPAMLEGRRIGVRAYSQTTGAWVRGILAREYGLAASSMQWVTFEDAHLAEYVDPAFASRAPAGQTLLAMLLSGELDAAILGNDLPDDPRLQAVIPDAQTAGPAAYARSGLLPLNHMLTVSRTLAQSHPDSLREIMRLMRLSKAAGGLATGIDFQPLDHEAIVPSLDLAIDLAFEQGLVSQRFCAEDVLAASRACLHA